MVTPDEGDLAQTTRVTSDRMKHGWTAGVGSGEGYGQLVWPAAAQLLLLTVSLTANAFSALTLMVGQQEEHPACKKTDWWGAGVGICLERGADLHMAQLMPLPLTVSCFSKIHISFTFLVPAYLGRPR